MRKKRQFIEGAFYHVTSRTNNKVRVFDNEIGREIMLQVLREAKEKFCFKLSNFCVMPTHLHLLVQPCEDANLSRIMHWIKLHSAKLWNFASGAENHVWGNRYFSRAIRDQQEYDSVMNYIDQNPVAAGLVPTPEEWRASGSFHKVRKISGLIG